MNNHINHVACISGTYEKQKHGDNGKQAMLAVEDLHVGTLLNQKTNMERSFTSATN